MRMKSVAETSATTKVRTADESQRKIAGFLRPARAGKLNTEKAKLLRATL